MTDFSDEYIELCRKLALPRELQPDDWVFLDKPRLVYSQRYLQGSVLDPKETPDLWWLPREGGWLDLLEAEGEVRVTIDSEDPRDGGTGYVAFCPYDRLTTEATYGAAGPDRLTALCRLYMAVTAAPSSPPEEEK
jgi:hypothetical protein